MTTSTTTTKPEAESAMDLILKRSSAHPKKGDAVEGAVIAIGKAAVYIELSPFGTGIIYGREYLNARDVLKKINIGDIVSAQVVEQQNDEGYIELSLHEARQARIWSEAEAAIKKKLIVELPVKEANKGGLILE